MGSPGQNPRLPAGERHCRCAKLFQCHGEQRRGHLLPRAEQLIQLPGAGGAAKFPRLGQELVGQIPLGGDYYHHLKPLPNRGKGEPCRAADFLPIGQRTPPKFLYKYCHRAILPTGYFQNKAQRYPLGPISTGILWKMGGFGENRIKSCARLPRRAGGGRSR